jgi:DNA polymerase-4
MARSAGTPTEIALRLRWEVRDKVGLPITVGVASTKHLAKVCSALAKPDGLMVVPPGCELDVLHRLPVERLWGVGPATTARLNAAGITRVAQVAAMEQAALAALVGPAAGRRLHHLSHNRDPRPVRAGGRRRTFGAQSALGRRPRSPEQLDSVLVGLVDRVTRRMRAKGRAGRTVVLRLRFDDYATATRSRTMRRSTSASSPILGVARGLLEDARPAVRERGLTLLGITVANLDGDGDPAQLTLPVEDEVDVRSVDAALDAVRERFGPAAVTRASLLGRDPGLAQFMVPSGGRFRAG